MKRFIFLVFVTFVTLIGYAKVVYVKSGGTGTTGVSWTEAVGSIADAMKNAQSGDVIYVAAGIYTQPWGTLKAGVSLLVVLPERNSQIRIAKELLIFLMILVMRRLLPLWMPRL